MPEARQIVLLCCAGGLFWLGDLAWIRLLPAFVVDPVWGDLAFLLSVPVAWICVRLGIRLAHLRSLQIVPGLALLVVVAALSHALALRWAPALYGGDHAGRLGSAWLLWIYGLILGFALLTASRTKRPSEGRLEASTPRSL